MRIFPLPAQQTEYSARLIRNVRLLLGCSLSCILATLLLVGFAWWRGPREVANTIGVAGPDGAFLGQAVLVGSDFVLCAVAVPHNVTIDFPDHSRIPAVAIRSEVLTPETTFTLLRLQTPALDGAVIYSPAEASSGIQVKAISSDTPWEGTLQDLGDGIFQPQPSFHLSPGAPVHDTAGGALAGITGVANGAGVVISTQRLFRAFPELKGGR